MDNNHIVMSSMESINNIDEDENKLLVAKSASGRVQHEIQVHTGEEKKKLRVKISRPAYTQKLFDERYRIDDKRIKSIKQRLRNHFNFKCNARCVLDAFLSSLPFINIMRDYNIKQDLLGDVVAGLTVGIMHIPQGMAYGLLTTLPAIYGLYVSFFPVILYFFLGTSKHISIGTFAVICLMVGSAVNKVGCDIHGADDTNQTLYNSTMDIANSTDNLEVIMCKVGAATAVTFITGIMQFAMGLCRMGFVTIYLSDPLTNGLTTGAAMHVFTSQVKHIFGVPVSTFQGPLKLVYTYIDFFSKIAKTNVAAFVMSVICIIFMVLVKELANPKVKKIIKMPIPAELIVVVLGTVTSYFWGMEEKFGVKVVGDIPTGIPPPKFPPVNRFSHLAIDALGIALVSFAINVSMVKLFSKKHNYATDANQELMAYGFTNFICSIFNCFASAASLSRSLIQESVGGKTQVAGLISSILLLVVLFAIGSLFEQLPKCVLAAIILVNLKGMFLQFNDLPKLWHISFYDFLTWLIVFLAVVLLDVDIGLGVGIGFCLLTVVFRTQRPYTCILGRVPSTDIYKDKAVYATATEIDGLKVFRFEASLYYANAEYFVNKLFLKTNTNPRKMKAAKKKLLKPSMPADIENNEAETILTHRKPRPSAELEIGEIDHHHSTPVTDIIIDCTTMGYIDYVGVQTLNQVMEEYEEVGVHVSLAGCKAAVRDMLVAAGYYEVMQRSQMFLSVHDAVLVALEKTPGRLEKAEIAFNTPKPEDQIAFNTPKPEEEPQSPDFSRNIQDF